MRKTLEGAAIGAVAMGWAMLAATPQAMAREFGAGPTLPAGVSMGVPLGAAPPPGFYGRSQTALSFGDVYDGDGNRTGDSLNVTASALQMLWAPGWELLGGQYTAFVAVAGVNADLDSSGLGHQTQLGLGDLEVNPFTLNWELAPGIYATSGVSIFAPIGTYDKDEPVNIGTGFWTITPSFGASYLRDGWNASIHAFYFKNLKNRDTDYLSGDEVMVNFTALKDVGGFSIGPVGYWRKQIKDDRNSGEAYGGAVAGRAEQAALGLGLSKRFGNAEAQVIYTRDLRVRNTVGGDKLWFNVMFPF
ncbi:MAG: transporter [Paracoccaceae bacterium]